MPSGVCCYHRTLTEGSAGSTARCPLQTSGDANRRRAKVFSLSLDASPFLGVIDSHSCTVPNAAVITGWMHFNHRGGGFYGERERSSAANATEDGGVGRRNKIRGRFLLLLRAAPSVLGLSFPRRWCKRSLPLQPYYYTNAKRELRFHFIRSRPTFKDVSVDKNRRDYYYFFLQTSSFFLMRFPGALT